MINRSIIAKATFALSFAVAGLGIATPALAVRASDAVPTAEIQVGGLNLNSPADRQILDRRIHVAASKVCPWVGSRMIEDFAHRRNCYNNAVAQARAQIAQRQARNPEQVAALSNPSNR